MVLREFIKQKYIKVASLIKPGLRVLDIGCNRAEILGFLPKVHYHGIDINKEVLNELKKNKINVSYADLNKNNLSLKGKFDYILLLDILEHVVDPKSLIEKSKVFLDNEGYFIISMPNDYHFLNKLRFLFNRELFNSFVPTGHLHIFPIKNGKKFLEQSGLFISAEFILPPTKPNFIPYSIKKLISRISPNNFARGILYLAKIRN
jgi:2-polyprenyl-3-methyl-5-hydroxy-6-metoxy-1,4-benzoquinol methylase